MLEREIRRLQIDHKALLHGSLVEAVGHKFNLLSADDVYAAVGYGGITVQQVIGRLREEYQQQYGTKEELPLPPLKQVKKATHAARGIVVQGMDNLLVRVARCCNPVPGDEIAGFITRGRGVSIHRKDCPNLNHQVNHQGADRGRLLEAAWEETAERSYPVEIEITAQDRTNLLADVMNAISESKVSISAVNARTDKNKMATIHLTLVVRDRIHLEQVMNKVRKVKDVYNVHRNIPG